MSMMLFISWFFEPMFVLFALCMLAGWHYGLTGWTMIIYSVYVSVFTALIGVTRYFLAKRSKTNWDLSDRKKRVVPLFVLTGIFVANLAVIRLFGVDLLVRYFGLWLVSIIGFSLLTTRIKISGHLSVLVMAIATIIMWYGSWTIPLLIAIPLVSWSRISLGRHTPVEVMGGITYAVLMVLVGNAWAVW